MTREDRLRFVVRFAQMDLGQLRPGDWLNLRDDLGKVFSASDIGILAAPLDGPMPNAYSSDDFALLQSNVQNVINLLLDLREAAGPRQKAQHAGWPEIRARYLFTNLDFLGARGRCALMIQGTTQCMFLLVLFHTLAHASTADICRCPECGAPFVRVRRQKYCTRQCVNRANLRAWRQTLKGKQQARASARRNYERRVRERLGEKVRVVQRPHKAK